MALVLKSLPELIRPENIKMDIPRQSWIREEVKKINSQQAPELEVRDQKLKRYQIFLPEEMRCSRD